MEIMGNGALYPRVLIVGQCFDAVTGGGITMRNLFQGWPKDRLAVVSSIDHQPDWSVCIQYYELGSLEWRVPWPGRYLQTRRRSGPVKVASECDKGIVVEVNFARANRGRHSEGVVGRTIRGCIDFLGARDLLRRLHLSRDLANWIGSFQPDLIYTQLAALNVVRLVTEIERLTHTPLVIHMMDDWPTTSYTSGILSPYLRWRMNEEFAPLVKKARALMGISQKMCQAFEQRYGRHFIPFHNPIDTQAWLEAAKKSWKAGSPFRLMYAGRIGRANRESLLNVCDAVAGLCASGSNIRFDLYTMEHGSDTGKAYLRNGCVFVNPPIPHSLMPSYLADADVLILPLDFEADSLRFAKYSMPTKTSEYMISGTPTLVYAPADLAVSEYAREKQWGYVVTEQTGGMLKQAILHLSGDQPLREQLGRRAQQLAMRNHDSALVREQFRKVLAEAGKGLEVNPRLHVEGVNLANRRVDK